MQPDILYEDNHIIILNKRAGEIVQGDKTGDVPLVDSVKEFIKERDAKPGNVFLGLPHRLDRPVSGLVVLAKTSKALARLNEMFRLGNVSKIYWAITSERPPKSEDSLHGFLRSDSRQNKSFVSSRPRSDAKEARLDYRLLGASDRYNLIEVTLLTGRKHQIRAMLSSIGCPVRGDLKYGAKRSNPDGSISLHARRIKFEHPVSKKMIDVVAPVPQHDPLWKYFENSQSDSE